MSDGRVSLSAKLKAVTVKDNGTIVQLEPDSYVTPEDVAELYRMRGKVLAVQLVDPEQPLPLEYADEQEPEQEPGLMLVGVLEREETEMAVLADHIPRYEQPMEPPTPARRHENCGHACELAGLLVCCYERDKVGRLGELYVIEDPAEEGCRDWVDE